MRTLVIDSATAACSVALFDDGALVAGDYRVLGRGHAEALVPMIAALPGKGRADRIAASLGPGSFTGVRVGIAAARALALAWEVEVFGYPALALVAVMARAERGAQPLAVAMAGGHGEWFVQEFADDGVASGALASLDPDAAAAAVAQPFVAGSEAEALVARRGFGQALALLPDAQCFALLPGHALTRDLHPLYGRAPDARLPELPAR
jgi:tRNA threonylcarbamoyladenosine biosynthesis protein TsaB